jgi:hypothetical protein
MPPDSYSPINWLLEFGEISTVVSTSALSPDSDMLRIPSA